MRHAKHALLIALFTLASIFAVSAQTTLRSPDDNRNVAPTVGTGGATGGPTGLFTVYDGQTLRRGEFTFSIAYSNFDRDPGNVDITEIPVSFQIGLSNNLELFFNTDAYRGIKVNNPQNLSSFYLPNSQLVQGTVPAAIVLAPGTTGIFANRPIFRPAGMPFIQFPFVGAIGTYGLNAPFFSGNVFGTTVTGPPRAGGAADNFPGVGSNFGSILPGVVLTTQTLNCRDAAGVAVAGTSCGTAPVVFSLAPSYLPDAPFINRRYGTSSFSTYNAGAKWRFTSPENPFGIGLVAFYRWYSDTASDAPGFNQLQRGASPGGNRGDIGASMFFDSRVARWANVSANVGYIYNSSVKGEFPTGTFTLLDRPDEFNYAVGIDFPVNQYFQPIVEYRQTYYVGGRTVNVFENDPLDILAGVRIFPRRWFGFGFAYRYHANSQDDVDNAAFSGNVATFDFPRINIVGGADVAQPGETINQLVVLQNSGSLANSFRTSTDPHGFIVQFWAGRRNARAERDQPDQFANVTAIKADSVEVILPCGPGQVSKSGACRDDQSVAISTTAVDPENATLTYSYTVSGGRVVGQGANVNWDLSGVRAGSYTITAAVDDGCGFCGTKQTQTITVRECPDCVTPCECPSVSVTGPSGITPIGDNMTFTANLSGGTTDAATFNWTVSTGTITSGQGTSTITVATNQDLAGQTITATVVVGGLCDTCTQTTANSSGEVATPPPPRDPVRVDEFGKIANDDLKLRLDSFFNELNADPTSTGVIINYGTAREAQRIERVIQGHITFRGFDASRIQLVRGGGTATNTVLWRVPAGATPPTP
jgi:hypothetical protein